MPAEWGWQHWGMESQCMPDPWRREGLAASLPRPLGVRAMRTPLCGSRGMESLRSPHAPYEAGPHRARPTADTNLGVVMLALLVMGLINYSMRDPCTC